MSAWKWYAVVVCSKDYYTLYEYTVTVKARNELEAGRKASDAADWHFPAAVIGPFDEEPKIDQ